MKKTIIQVVAVVAVIAAVLYGASRFMPQKNEVPQLSGVEVREYQGKDLSSINQFSENSIKGPQQVDIAAYRLEVNGLVQNPASYTYDEVLNKYKHYKKVVRLNCVEGWSVNILWEGFLLKDVFAEVKAKPEAKIVIFHAVDGYTTSMPVSFLTDNNIMIAYRMNEVTMPPERGYPFQLVAEDKWGYKWIKWITRIELSDNVNYRGYWEEYGYSNNGTYPFSFFGD